MPRIKTLKLAHVAPEPQGDLSSVFARGYDVVFGTAPADRRSTRVAAYEAGYMLYMHEGVLIALRRSLFPPQTYSFGEALGVSWVRCWITGIGRAAFLASDDVPAGEVGLYSVAEALGLEDCAIFYSGNPVLFNEFDVFQGENAKNPTIAAFDKESRIRVKNLRPSEDESLIEAGFTVRLQGD